jgi:hypothetical protein
VKYPQHGQHNQAFISGLLQSSLRIERFIPNRTINHDPRFRLIHPRNTLIHNRVVHLVAGDIELECGKSDSRDAFVSARFDDCDFLVAAELAQLLRFRVDGGLGWRFEAELELHVCCGREVWVRDFRVTLSGQKDRDRSGRLWQ